MRKHSVLLKEELCEGCTNCVKNCPTKAIRVLQGKARIKAELCIDCAECIRICAYHAKYSLTGTMADLEAFQYPIVLIPPSFYAQFKGVNPRKVKAALKKLGFRDVVDVSLAAEALSIKTAAFLNENPGIYISSSCPVVVRLIQIQYPELIGHLAPFKSPVEAAAERARLESIKQGVPENEVGVFFITPCPAKNTSIVDSIGLEKSFIDHSISASLAYQAIREILSQFPDLENEAASEPLPFLGMGWGQSGGELRLLHEEIQNRSLSVSGIHRVKSLLKELSRNNIQDVQYFELNACNYGCVGGIFNVANVFQARSNLRQLRAEGTEIVVHDPDSYNFELTAEIEPSQTGRLDPDLAKAMIKLNQLEEEIKALPGLDCAACGAPDCRTLAEDIVNGLAQRSDCMILLRKQMPTNDSSMEKAR